MKRTIKINTTFSQFKARSYQPFRNSANVVLKLVSDDDVMIPDFTSTVSANLPPVMELEAWTSS